MNEASSKAADEIEDFPPVKRRKLKFDETDETKNLTNGELQRLVLLEQLKLIRMQQEDFEKRKKNNNGEGERITYSLSSSTPNIISDSGSTFYNL